MEEGHLSVLAQVEYGPELLANIKKCHITHITMPILLLEKHFLQPCFSKMNGSGLVLNQSGILKLT